MFRHPHLVVLMGFARNGPKRFLVPPPQAEMLICSETFFLGGQKSDGAFLVINHEKHFF
jgi:hypothetical protein